MLNILSCAHCHLYIFFREIFLQIFAYFNWIIFIVDLSELFMYCRHKSFIRFANIFANIFFHFPSCLFTLILSFQVHLLNKLCSNFQFFKIWLLVLLVSYLRNHYPLQCDKDLNLCFF